MNKAARINIDDVFHVHTFRCGHAEMIPDEAYIEKAVEMGAKGIWFTDHAPFPGNPFGARMAYEELDEYLDSLHALKKKYLGRIAVHVGLEIEYFPSFDRKGYYAQLKKDPRVEVMLLGQHMAETEPGRYSFSLPSFVLSQQEYQLLGKAVRQGIRTGYFDAAAHPDRIFRRKRCWDAGMEETAGEIIRAAAECELPLEMNLCSYEYRYYCRPQFWQMVQPGSPVITGLDAHSLYELEERYRRQLQWGSNDQILRHLQGERNE